MVQLTDNVWAAEVPDDASNIVVHGYLLENKSAFIYSTTLNGVAFDRAFDLPPGSWQYLFTTKEATWEQAEGVVEEINWWYKNYEGDILYSNPVDSLQSMLKAKGCDVNKNWAIIQTATNE